MSYKQDISVEMRRSRCLKKTKKLKFFQHEISLGTILEILLLYIIVFILPRILQLSFVQTIIFSVIVCLLYLLTVVAISLAPFSFRWAKEHLNWLLLLFVPLFVLLIAILFISCFDFQGDNEIRKADVLSFGGDYIAFVGAFCLGYFLYLKEQDRERKEKRLQIQLLLDSLEIAHRSLMKIKTLTSSIENNKNADEVLKGKIKKIEYDTRWRLNYYSYESLCGPNPYLKDSIELFWAMLERVNDNLEVGKISRAAQIYSEYIDETCFYAIQGYDFFEMSLILSEACHDFWMPHEKGFLYQKETKAEINQLKKKYYPVIENHIYNYLVKESLTESEDHEIIQRDTVDWLCNNSEEIKNYIDDPRKMRAISCVVFECSVQFEHQPSRVGYCWGTYSLRK